MDDLHLAIEEDDIGAFQEFGVNVPETTETNAGRNDQSLETRMSDYDQPFREKVHLFSEQAFVLFTVAAATPVLSMIVRRPATLRPEVRWICQPFSRGCRRSVTEPIRLGMPRRAGKALKSRAVTPQP